VSSELTKTYKRVSLFEKQFYFGFGISTGFIARPVEVEDIERYFTLIGQSIKTSVNPETNQKETNISEFKFQACKEMFGNNSFIKDVFKGEGYVYKIALEHGLCPPIDYLDHVNGLWDIKGDMFNLPYERISLKLFPCSKERKEDCIENEQLTYDTIITALVAKALDFSNKTNPVTIRRDPTLDLKIHP
jgi:hypothetical protein